MSAPNTNRTTWMDVILNILTAGYWSLWMKYRCRHKCH